MMSLSSAYERSTCPSFCRITYRVELRSGFLVSTWYTKMVNDYVHFSRVHLTDMAPHPIYLICPLRDLPHGNFRLMKEYQLNHSETGVSYRRKHVSAHCILWPNELMLFLGGLYVTMVGNVGRLSRDDVWQDCKRIGTKPIVQLILHVFKIKFL